MRQASDDARAPVGGPTTVPRRARDEDVPRIASLHRSELGHGLYPMLGERFLRHYHRANIASPYAICGVVGAIGWPDGFVVTLVDPPAHRAWLRGRASVLLSVHGIIGLLTHPRALLLFLRTRVGRYLRALLHRGRSSPASAATDAPAVLLHIAVDPAARGRGIGSVLVDQTLRTATAAGRDRVRLVTAVGSPGERFYARLGWRRVGRRQGRDGSPVVEFEHPTGPDRP